MKNRALKYTLILTLIGILITALMAFLVWTPGSVQQRNAPFIALGDHIKNELIQTPPLFEKAVSGDATVNFEKQILSPIATSRNLVQKAYDGEDSELGAFEKTDDEELKIIYKETINDLDKLAETAKERMAAHQIARNSVGDSVMEISTQQAAVAVDLKYEAAYQHTLVTIDRLTTYLVTETNAHAAMFQKFSWVTIVVTAIVF